MGAETKIDLIKIDSVQGKAAKGDEKKTSPEELNHEGGKGKKKSFLICGIVGLILLVGAGAAALKLGWISMPGSPQDKKTESHAAERKEVGPMLKLSPMIINLKEESGTHYIKTTVVLEVSKKDWVEEVDKRKSFLTDTIILALSDKQLEDLKHPESKEHLKEEILTKVNQPFEPKKINRIYFDEFLYQ